MTARSQTSVSLLFSRRASLGTLSVRRQITPSNRSGLLTPLVAMALVVSMGCVALVLDRMWLEAARTELSACAEVAALAAARQLAHDDLLRTESDPQQRATAARQAAAGIASVNFVAGAPVRLNANPGGDVRLGRLVTDANSGITRFIETAGNPTSVLVTARRTRRTSNPLSLLRLSPAGRRHADLIQRAEATIDNRILGVRPFNGVPVPALPLAILGDDPSGNRSDTWNIQIEQRAGADRYTFDPQSGLIQPGPDGIPEIVLRSMAVRGEMDDVNVHLVDLGTDLRTGQLDRQMTRGWTQDDLRGFGGELLLGTAALELTVGAVIAGDVSPGLERMIGHCRICVLYSDYQPAGNTGIGRARFVGLVAGRVMAVHRLEEESCEIIFQPGLLTTRTAILADAMDSPEPRNVVPNRYIYKLQLTQ